jgi:chromosome partitioning protein
LAACFAGDRKEVLLIDADPQRTALDWRADRPDDKPQVQTIGLPVRNLHQEIAPFQRKYEVIIIDGGGRVTATAHAAVTVADFVIVPTLASKPDVLSTQDFFRQVIEEVTAVKEVRGAILINQVQTGTVINRECQEQLFTLGYPVFSTNLHLYVAYKETIAAGLSVMEYDIQSKAAQELTAFFREVRVVLV